MNEQVFHIPMNVILEGYQPIHVGNVDPKRPPRGGSAVVPRPQHSEPRSARDQTDKSKD